MPYDVDFGGPGDSSGDKRVNVSRSYWRIFQLFVCQVELIDDEGVATSDNDVVAPWPE